MYEITEKITVGKNEIMDSKKTRNTSEILRCLGINVPYNETSTVLENFAKNFTGNKHLEVSTIVLGSYSHKRFPPEIEIKINNPVTGNNKTLEFPFSVAKFVKTCGEIARAPKKERQADNLRELVFIFWREHLQEIYGDSDFYILDEHLALCQIIKKITKSSGVYVSYNEMLQPCLTILGEICLDRFPLIFPMKESKTKKIIKKIKNKFGGNKNKQ